MRARIAKFLGHEPKGMWCGTFHALGARMLRGVAPIVGREQNFTIYDEDDTIDDDEVDDEDCDSDCSDAATEPADDMLALSKRPQK